MASTGMIAAKIISGIGDASVDWKCLAFILWLTGTLSSRAQENKWRLLTFLSIQLYFRCPRFLSKEPLWGIYHTCQFILIVWNKCRDPGPGKNQSPYYRVYSISCSYQNYRTTHFLLFFSFQNIFLFTCKKSFYE